jgi:hypothetical protein
MFRITQDPSSGSTDLYLITTTCSGLTVLVVYAVGYCMHAPQVLNMPPNTDSTFPGVTEGDRNKWTKGIVHVLRDPRGRLEFEKFLTGHESEFKDHVKILDLWVRCDELKKGWCK